MISATEARELDARPPFTEEEIDQAIREAATTQDYTCFKKSRMTDDLLAALREYGFTVDSGPTTWIVRWEAKAA